jgi:tetratricopeptide (TPR) repeat protein
MKHITVSLWLLLSSALVLGASERNSAFESGKRNFESGNYEKAIELFSQAISSPSDSAQRNRAYYYQGLALFEQGLYFSSFISFRNVLLAAEDKNREIHEKAIKNAAIITDRLDMVEKLGKVIDKLPAGYVPGSAGGVAHYVQGVYHFSNGQYESALSHFKSVSPDSQFYDKALMYLGILSTRAKNYKESSFYFSKLLEISQGKKDLFPQAELARLNLARTYYSAGNIEKSIELYSQFLSSSPYWLTVLQEAGWPLMRANDTTVSLGNLHTVLSPFYREDLVGESYILKATILYSLCKYEEMKRTLTQFFNVYDPVIRSMQQETSSLGSADAFYRAFASEKGMSSAFLNFIKRDSGISRDVKILNLLKAERNQLARFSRNSQINNMINLIQEAEKGRETQMGLAMQRIHRKKLTDLLAQREQANYLKVEIVTGEKDLIEGQRGLPPKRVTDVETSVASGYHFWPFTGEYWQDEMGTYVYTTESACVN